MNRSGRLGFTLVELLVVIAIIGILIALLLPAVQAAREAARRAQCTNNLKQLALACHNYHDTYQRFPAGQIVSGVTGASSAGWGWGWSAMILPQMEQSTIRDQIDCGQAMAAPQNIGLVRTRIQSFLCPSATKVPENGVPTGNPSGSGAFLIANPGVAPASYVGNGGAFSNSFNPTEPADKKNGILMRDSGIRMADILDGTSNTALLGEAIHYDFLWDPKLYGNARSSNGSSDAGLALLRIGEQRINPPSNASQVVLRESFASYHPGGANFALCDGSVRFVGETIYHTGTTYAQWTADKTVLGTFQRLIARDDALPLGDF